MKTVWSFLIKRLKKGKGRCQIVVTEDPLHSGRPLIALSPESAKNFPALKKTKLQIAEPVDKNLSSPHYLRAAKIRFTRRSA